MVLKIAHRGIPVLEPENTLASFKKAISFGADMIECDVWLKNGTVVVSHDESDKEGLPLLEDVLKLKSKFNVDIKDPEVLGHITLQEGILYSSNKARVLMNIKKQNPKIQTSLIFNSRLLVWLLPQFAHIAKVNFVSLHDSLATRKLIDKLHEDYFKVYVYTVNSKERIKELINMGVDGIFTDDVRLFKE